MRLCKGCDKPYWAGQAFRTYQCIMCMQTKHHPNTAIPKICHDCSNKFHLCQRCGANTK